MLQRLTDAQEAQAAVCGECSVLSAAYSGVGVIHRHKGADDANKTAAKEKSKIKENAWNAMLAHLYDPRFSEVHNAGQVRTGWWTKWLKRVQDHISPAYIRRGLSLNPVVARRRYHEHPVHLVSGEGEAPVVEQAGRVDVSWLQHHGIPRPGQFAVIRGADRVQEPFYVVEIVAVRGLDGAAKAEVAMVEAEEASRAAEEAMRAAERQVARREADASGAAAGAAAAGAPR